MVALKDGSEGLEGTRVIGIADEIEMLVGRHVSVHAPH